MIRTRYRSLHGNILHKILMRRRSRRKEGEALITEVYEAATTEGELAC